MIRIIIGGDICPMGNIQKSFINGDADEIFHDLLEDIANADLSIANLECPLISGETPIKKPGGVLGANSKSINGFVAAKWDILNLANNHSFDHGARGLQETIDRIQRASLSMVGAGKNLNEAQTPYIKEIKGQRIVIYSMAEREFSVADDKIPGSNPLDLIDFVNAIRLYKQEGVFIVLLHGGKEFYQYPSPETIRRCRFMVDMGANAVICCHTHCPLPWEIYSDHPIIYGLGNLIFEPFHKPLKSWYEGYLVRLNIEDGHVRFEPIPYIQSQTKLGAQKMEESSRRHFFDEMQRKSAELKNNVLLKEQWLKYCRQQRNKYLEILFAYNRFMRKAGMFLFRLLHPKNEILQALLLVQCETHREILNTIFRDERHKE